MASSAIKRPLVRIVSQKGVTSRGYSTYYPKAPQSPPTASRPFHTTKALNTSRDNSTIDFAYMPQEDLAQPALKEVMRIPLLPNNFSTPHRDDADFSTVIDAVSKPLISTVSANGTHIDLPSAMSDVTDNHSIELDPFELTNKVSSAATRSSVGSTSSGSEKRGTVQQFWSGLVDDIFGERKVSVTA